MAGWYWRIIRDAGEISCSSCLRMISLRHDNSCVWPWLAFYLAFGRAFLIRRIRFRCRKLSFPDPKMMWALVIRFALVSRLVLYPVLLFSFSCFVLFSSRSLLGKSSSSSWSFFLLFSTSSQFWRSSLSSSSCRLGWHIGQETATHGLSYSSQIFPSWLYNSSIIFCILQKISRKLTDCWSS